VAGGLHSVGLSYGRDLRAETVQVFVANLIVPRRQ